MARDEEFERIKKAAQKGDPEAMFDRATYFGGSTPEGLPWLEKAAAAGWKPALTVLGYAHAQGEYGARRDLVKAIAFYEQAIAAGETEFAGNPITKKLQQAKLALKRSGNAPTDPVAALFEDNKLVDEKAKIIAAELPSVRWLAAPAKKDDAPLGASKIGGSPDLPAGVDWPKPEARALEHVATIDLATLPAADGVPKLTGRLLFFIDEKNLLGSDDDDMPQVADAVIHVPAGAKLQRAKAPRGTKTFKPSRLTPKLESTLPAVESHAWRALGLKKAKNDRYANLRDAWPTERADEVHRSFGHGDIHLESETPEPVLLLQLDSYEHGDVMWGDAGKLFWWISPRDLKAKRFDRARLEVQF